MNDYRLIHDAFRASLDNNGDYLMHYGRKGMRWGRSIFQDDYVPVGEEATGDENGNQWWEDAYGKASSAYNSAKNAIGNAARNAYNTAKPYVDDAYKNHIQPGLNNAREKAGEAITNAYNTKVTGNTYQENMRNAAAQMKRLASHQRSRGNQPAPTTSADLFNMRRQGSSNRGNSQNAFQRGMSDYGRAKRDYQNNLDAYNRSLAGTANRVGNNIASGARNAAAKAGDYVDRNVTGKAYASDVKRGKSGNVGDRMTGYAARNAYDNALLPRAGRGASNAARAAGRGISNAATDASLRAQRAAGRALSLIEGHEGRVRVGNYVGPYPDGRNTGDDMVRAANKRIAQRRRRRRSGN